MAAQERVPMMCTMSCKLDTIRTFAQNVAGVRKCHKIMMES
jgi:hypothetical protein